MWGVQVVGMSQFGGGMVERKCSVWGVVFGASVRGSSVVGGCAGFRG